MHRMIKEVSTVTRKIVPGTIKTEDCGVNFSVNSVEEGRYVNFQFGHAVSPASQTGSAHDLRELARLFFAMADVLDPKK